MFFYGKFIFYEASYLLSFLIIFTTQTLYYCFLKEFPTKVTKSTVGILCITNKINESSSDADSKLFPISKMKNKIYTLK